MAMLTHQAHFRLFSCLECTFLIEDKESVLNTSYCILSSIGLSK